MEQESDLVKIGYYIDMLYKEKNKYERKIIIDKISPDILKRVKDIVIVIEVKKSDKFREAALWQLKYYLWYLKQLGINAKGKLVIPEYNKEEIIELSDKDVEKLRKIIKEIKKIINLEKPPKEIMKSYCKACAYYPLCWD